jgi:hypothetical protein
MQKNAFAGVGLSKADDSFTAGKEAVEKAINEMKKQGGKKPTFGVVFCSGGKYGKDDKTLQKLVDGAHSVFEGTPWIGCTTAGELSNYGFTENSCVALAVESEYIHVGIGISNNTNEKPKEAGKEAIKEALNSIKVDEYVEPYIRYLAEKKLPMSELIKMIPYYVLMLTTGFTCTRRGNEDDIVEGIIDVIGPRIPIFGGSSADDLNLKKTYVFCNGKIYDNSVIVALISTGLKIGFRVEHGYVPTEKSMFVNKAKDYIVYELNGGTAFDKYAEVLEKKKEEIWPASMKLQQLGPISTAFMGFAKNLGMDVMKLSPIIEINCNTPLALCEYKPYVKGRFWVKAIDSIVDGKYIRFTEKVPQGTALYLMKTTNEKSLKAAQESVKESLKEVEGKGAFGIVIDCALHRWFLGKHAKLSTELMEKNMKNIPFIGMFAYGEILDGKHTLSVASMVVGEKLVVSNNIKT